MALASAQYEPRSPGTTVLSQIVRDHFETFRLQASQLRDGEGLPTFVERAFKGFLRCGWVAGGLRAFSLRRVWPRPPRRFLLQGPGALSKLWRSPHGGACRASGRSGAPGRARAFSVQTGAAQLLDQRLDVNGALHREQDGGVYGGRSGTLEYAHPPDCRLDGCCLSGKLHSMVCIEFSLPNSSVVSNQRCAFVDVRRPPRHRRYDGHDPSDYPEPQD